MKRIIFIALAIGIISCTPNIECRNQSFGDHTWKRDSGNIGMDNWKFKNDETMSFTSGSTTLSFKYKFDEDCNGFTLTQVSPPHWSIIKNTGNILWLETFYDSDQYNIYLHRQ